MIKVAICDDVISHNKTVQDYCNKLTINKKIHISTELFNSGEELLEFYESHEERFNIIFLDVDMGVNRKNGLETAGVIREQYDTKVHIVFLTNYPEYMQKGYYTQATNFLIKPFLYESFEAEFKRICDLMKKAQNNVYIVRTVAINSPNAEDIVLNLDEVLYFMYCKTSYRKSESLVITNSQSYKNPINITSSISKITDDLKDRDFITVIRGVLVNVNHISGFIVNSPELKLDTGELLRYSKGNLKKIKAEYNRIKLSRW